MFCGADTDELRSHADALEAAEGRCAQLLAQLTAAVRSVDWVGVDADNFRESFESSTTQLWTRSLERLRLSSRAILGHADEQDGASEGDGGASTVTARLQPWWPVGGNSVSASAGLNLLDRESDEDSPPVNSDGSIDGPAPFGGAGLGEGVPGTGAVAPAPPEWTPADKGSGEWGTQEPTDADRETMDLVEKLIFGGYMVGNGAASDNLRHYVENTGEDKSIDVDDMMSSVPSFDTAVSETRQVVGAEAIDRARESGATGPVTFPVNTAWAGGQADKSVSEKYFYATGSFDYNLNGTVTAYPPQSPGGEWTYEMSTQVNVRDRYNWDVGKGVNVDVPDWVPGMPDNVSIPDEQMGSLHKSGLAREYNIVGESEVREKTGP